MKIALAAARVIDHDLEYNISQVEKFLGQARESGADLLCFGETFLQGFDSLHWNFAEDRETALRLDGPVMEALCRKTAETRVDLLLGFVEREGERLYSSCALLSQGKPLHCYRRISKGWKEYQRTDSHYCEGTEITPFSYRGVRCLIALCGDLWDMPERFCQDATLLFWPVYISYSPEEWETGIREEYARQAARACGHTLLINSICDGDAFGGCSEFVSGQCRSALPMGQEGLLLVEVP